MATRRDQPDRPRRGSPRPIRDALLKALKEMAEEAIARSDHGDDELLLQLDALLQAIKTGKMPGKM